MSFFSRFSKVGTIFNQISLNRLLVPMALIAVITVITAYKFSYKLYVEFAAINGVYQTFNPVQRLFDGQVPSLDFTAYLGIGTTSLTAAFSSLLGQTFAAVTFSNHFLHSFCHFLALFILLYILGLSSKRSLLLAAIAIGIHFIFIRPTESWTTLTAPFTVSVPLMTAWIELMDPGLSNLGLRSALPFLTAIALLIGTFTLKHRPFWLVIYTGVLIGMQPLWSNDYGLISTLILFLISTLILFKQSSIHKFKAFLLLGSSSILSFLFITSMVTRGHPQSWVQENILGVGRDQFWYFDAAPAKAFSLAQLFPEPFLYYNIGLLGILFLYICFTPLDTRKTLLLYIGSTTLGAGFITSAGGSVSSRYFIPALFVFYFLLIFWGLLLFKGIFWLISRYIPGVPHQLTRIRDRLPLRRFPKIAAFCLLALYVYGMIVALNHLPGGPRGSSHFYINQLGGWLPNSYWRATQIAETLKHETENLPPTRRILSTYASMIDTLAGSRNATGIDYIIHALGDKARTRYRDRFHAAQPEFITTIREDYTTWETWIRRTNWWFYREFLRDYQPVDATFYNVIWRRKPGVNSAPSLPIQCEIQPQNANSVTLIFTSDRPTQPGGESTYFLDVELNYGIQVTPTGVPLLGQRGLVNASEAKILSPTMPPEPLVTYGLPPQHPNWHIPVRHQLGTPSTVTLTGFPADRATLQVASCKAQVLVPTQLFELTEATTAKNFSDERWQRGVAINTVNNRENIPSLAGFLLNDLQSQGLIVPGMMIEFPGSGVRQVVAVRESEVWVSGAPLNPNRDGYPNAIRLKIK